MSDYLTAHIGTDGFEYAIAYVGKSSTFEDLERIVRAQLKGGAEVTIRFEAQPVQIKINPDTVEIIEPAYATHEAGNHDGDTDSQIIENAKRGCVICQDWTDEIKYTDEVTAKHYGEAFGENYATPEEDHWSAQSDRIEEFNRQ